MKDIKFKLNYGNGHVCNIETNVNFITADALLNAKVRPHAYDCEIKHRLGDFMRSPNTKGKHTLQSTLKDLKEIISRYKNISETYYIKWYKVVEYGNKPYYVADMTYVLKGE